MTPRFVFRPAARADLLEARTWYESQRAGLGADVTAAVEETLQRIGDHPELYPEVRPGLRRVVLFDFPYSVFYRRASAVIEVIAIFHHRRDPLVWQTRDDV